MDLDKYRVGELPTLYYIPDAVSPAEEERLLREIRASKQQWKSVSGRRLQSLGGMVHKQGLIPAPLPGFLEPLLAKLAADTGMYGSGGELPNHVLVNAYEVRLSTVCLSHACMWNACNILTAVHLALSLPAARGWHLAA
jgi:alkylated DNA repair protein alkB family protein 6